MTSGPHDHLIGELKPGDKGWLPLDSAGNPTGPATLKPPPALDSKACSVMANSKNPLEDDDHALLSSTGAELDPILNSNVDRRVTPGDPIVPPVEMLNPSLNTINPSSAKINVVPFTVNINGNNFYPESKVHFGNGFVPPAFVNSGQLRITIDPAQYIVGSFLVHVDNNGSLSTNKTFTFNPA